MQTQTSTDRDQLPIMVLLNELRRMADAAERIQIAAKTLASNHQISIADDPAPFGD